MKKGVYQLLSLTSEVSSKTYLALGMRSKQIISLGQDVVAEIQYFECHCDS